MGSGYLNMVLEPRKGREGRRKKKKRRGEYGFRLLEYGAVTHNKKKEDKEEEGRRGEYGFRLLEYGAGAQKRK